MKRIRLLRYIERYGCDCLREGAHHTVYINRKERKISTILGHREIDENLARKICKDLGIPKP